VRELVFEALLRLSRVVLATVLGLIVWGIAVGPIGAAGSVELWLLCWLAGAAFILLIDRSPL
jgi:hypothetical protein